MMFIILNSIMFYFSNYIYCLKYKNILNNNKNKQWILTILIKLFNFYLHCTKYIFHIFIYNYIFFSFFYNKKKKKKKS